MGKPPSYLQRLASNLHPQLPLTSRDSQRLLGLLNTTFQKQLDMKHPPPPSQSQPHPQTKHVAHTYSWDGHKPATKEVTSSPSPYKSASEHLATILSNPLFTFQRPSLGGSNGRDPHAQENRVDPVAWFISKVATGSADIDIAEECLLAVMKEAKILGAQKDREVLMKYQAGWHVLNWLRSSGEEVSITWKQSQTFCKALARCLVVEGRGAFVLAWLRQSTSSGLDRDQDLKWRRYLTKGYILANHNYCGGVDAAVRAFVECATAHSTTVDSRIQDLKYIASRIIQAIMLKDGSAKISSENYDALTGILEPWTGEKPFVSALLALHHPTKPSAAHLLKLLDQQRLSLASQDALKPNSPTRVLDGMSVGACLDAAELCFSQQDFRNGSRLLNFVKQSLSAKHGPDIIRHPLMERSEKSELPTSYISFG